MGEFVAVEMYDHRTGHQDREADGGRQRASLLLALGEPEQAAAFAFCARYSTR